MFWSNHFCVSANKGPVRGIAGAYEREAIRPHVLGRFADMLLAVDAAPGHADLSRQRSSRSVPTAGPGINRGRGLNENLAREILELHTLGVDGGYSQEDVTNLARILTGWTVGTLDNPLAEPGKFFFAPARHEPGDWTVLGKRYRDQGQLQRARRCCAIWRSIRRPRATSRASSPGTSLPTIHRQPSLQQLETTFLRHRRRPGAVAKSAGDESPQAWQAPPAKVLPPYDFLVAVVRGFALEPKPRRAAAPLRLLGQPLWRPPSPAGWPDARRRMGGTFGPARAAAHRRGGGAPGRPPRRSARVADDILGDGIGARHACRRSPAPRRASRASSCLIMSPEFQRR